MLWLAESKWNKNKQPESDREGDFAHIGVTIHIMYQLCKLAHKSNDQWPIKITLHCLIFTTRQHTILIQIFRKMGQSTHFIDNNYWWPSRTIIALDSKMHRSIETNAFRLCPNYYYLCARNAHREHSKALLENMWWFFAAADLLLRNRSEFLAIRSWQTHEHKKCYAFRSYRSFDLVSGGHIT